MHTRRKELALVLALSVVMTLVFAVATLVRPLWFFGIFLTVFGVVSLLLGYRVFAYSDDWFRAQERKEQEWYAKHPRLTVLLTLLAALGFLWQLYDFIQRRF